MGETMTNPHSAKIRALNDHARQRVDPCRWVITQGVLTCDPLTVAQLLIAVGDFDDFTADNDPNGEHDFGSLYWGEHQVFWRLDYYDLDFTLHSPDPADETVTARVLTVMLAEEY